MTAARSGGGGGGGVPRKEQISEARLWRKTFFAERGAIGRRKTSAFLAVAMCEKKKREGSSAYKSRCLDQNLCRGGRRRPGLRTPLMLRRPSRARSEDGRVRQTQPLRRDMKSRTDVIVQGPRCCRQETEHRN